MRSVSAMRVGVGSSRASPGGSGMGWLNAGSSQRVVLEPHVLQLLGQVLILRCKVPRFEAGMQDAIFQTSDMGFPSLPQRTLRKAILFSPPRTSR